MRLLFALLLPVAGLRAQPLSTDRPDFTEAPVAVRRAQLEAGVTGMRSAGAAAYSLGEVLLRLPVGRGLEARVQGGLDRAAGAWLASDVGVGAKLVLRAEAPALAVLAGVGLAGFTRASRVAGSVAEVKFIGSVDVGPGMALSANLNVAKGRGDASELGGSLSLGADLAARLGAYAEVYALQAFPLHTRCAPLEAAGCPPREAVQPFANAGLTFRPVPSVQFDVRAGVGRERTVFVGTGASVRL